ncbi:hypothetical protein ACFWUW_12985 [Streptomyces sp. NPDC058655]|uniref:hypothetical protein n=1 Tax=Streptomyces sp. NPDC058655 TaxID=3346577 RepID=UPI00364D08BF
MTLTYAREPEARSAGATGRGGTEVEPVRAISEIVQVFGMSHERSMPEFRDRRIHHIIERIACTTEADPFAADPRAGGPDRPALLYGLVAPGGRDRGST